MNNYCIVLVILSLQFGQVAPEIGLRERPSTWMAFTNATLHISPDETISNGNLITRDGRIESVGRAVPVPTHAKVIDCNGKHIYPGFIDMYVPVDVQQHSHSATAHWNKKVHPEVSANLDSASFNKISQMRDLGFTIASVSPSKGIFRGRNQILSLGELNSGAIIAGRTLQHLAFEHGGWGDNEYPNSLLGAIALLRQTFSDASWYGQAWEIYKKYPKMNTRPQVDDALENLTQFNGVYIFRADSEPATERIIKLQNEFDLNIGLVASGYEYRNLHLFKANQSFLIVPVSFPSVPHVHTHSAALEVNLSTLKHWDQAPFNPHKLVDNGHAIAITAFGSKKEKFRKNLNKAVRHGLSKKDALAALTTTPAKKLGLDEKLGTLEEGKSAHLFISDGDYFDKQSQVLSVWIDDDEFIINDQPDVDIRGVWHLVDTNNLDSLIFSGNAISPTGKAFQDTAKIQLKKLNYIYPQISFSYSIEDSEDKKKTVFRFSGHVNGNEISGLLTDSEGENTLNVFEKIRPHHPEDKKDEKQDVVLWKEPNYPEGAYGFEDTPIQQNIILKNATVWTSAKDGILENTHVLIENGKISKIGQDLRTPKGILEFDAAGKHITAGLVDAHSHTALSAVNEGSQAITSEVRIQDVIDPYDIAIYRELAGGLTSANQLHGSANPIGGQNAIIKLRWGNTATDMIIKDAAQGIKFALGENVKQSNWGDKYTTRYPQTRMGVDQLIRDAFNASLEYEQRWQDYKKSNKKKTAAPRRDLELEALLEILRGKRDIHCHSYRQDEILNLIRIADDFGFTIGTFQHVLEGYKVAEAIKEHGAHASTFSDWWAYKFEVYDAIPYNGAIMHETGVVVSFNSDSNELARRMNLEGAKGMKYGNMSPEDALNLVTINPAIQLGIDHRTGSLEVGKDADFVVWSGDPLSTYSICEQTWIDGRKYFDIEVDAQMVERDTQLRNALIQKALASHEKPDKGQKKKKKRHYQEHSCGVEVIQ